MNINRLFMPLHSSLKIFPAQPNELETVIQILSEATRWLQSKGIDQWRPEFISRTHILEQIRKCEVNLARQNGQVVGTITLQWSDPRFWGERPPDAGYIHKLALKPEHTHRGIGREMLEWSLKQTKAAGKRYARLDCMYANPKLRQYYEDAGFEYRSELRLQDLRFALYEKKL